MVRIYGIGADQLEIIRMLVSDANEYESGLYVVQLYDNVQVKYSFGDVQISDCAITVTLEMLDYEKTVIS